MSHVPSHVQEPAFGADFAAAIQGLRGALIDVLSSVGAAPDDPQDIARRFGIHHLLAWRLSKIAISTDLATPGRQLPGAKGLKILDGAFGTTGVPEERAAAFRGSIDAYRQMIDRHAGDAGMLDVMLASRQDDPAFADAAVSLRKQAFRGAAAIWGSYARLQLAISVIAPASGDDELVDLGHLNGYLDFCLLRETGRWPEHFGLAATDDGKLMERDRTGSHGKSLVRQFCSVPQARLDDLSHGEQTVFKIGQVGVGKTGRLSWIVERIMPAMASRYRGAGNEFGQYMTFVRLPVQTHLHDLLVHRDLPFDLPPAALLYGDLSGAHAAKGIAPSGREPLPLAETVVPLGSGPPKMSTPHVSRSTEMSEYICGRLGRQLSEFVAYRFVMEYPPMPSLLSLRHPTLTR